MASGLTVKLHARISDVGVLETIRAGFRQICAILFATSEYDRAHGTDTAKCRPLWLGLTIRSTNVKDGSRYQAIPEDRLRHAIQRLPIDPAKTAFLDLGCGKGLPLLVAHEFGFWRITGVEFAKQLVKTARRNARIMGANANIIYGDATEYHLDEPGPTVIFLYNPFGLSVMQRVADNLRSHQGHLFIVYFTPLHPEPFDAWLPRIHREPDYIIWEARAGLNA